MIQPTVGRVVHYWPGEAVKGSQPYAAVITYVHSDTCVNLVVFDANGNAGGANSVTLHQEGNERPVCGFAEWMPYQKGQAAKTEALEALVGTQTALSPEPAPRPIFATLVEGTGVPAAQ